jgi:hypothetical protein
MGVESYALGADVEYPNDISIGGSITATPDKGVDGINVGIQIGDTDAPEGVESTTTQQWRLLDGSVREIDLPRISAEKKDEDPKASIGATAVFEPVGEDTGVTAQPHVSLSAGTNTRGDDALLLRGGVTLPDAGAQFTGSVSSDDGQVSVGLTDYAVDTSNPNEAFSDDDVQLSADSPKDAAGLNDDALGESLGLLKF